MLTDARKRILPLHITLTPEERLSVWTRVRKMWKRKGGAQIKELKQIRAEWDRKLPNLH